MDVMNKHKHEPGFTIIEVSLVLAIAGLIFLMVFIALPALQRSQRDMHRKNDMNRAASALNRYKSNNKGELPNFPNPVFSQVVGGTPLASYLLPEGEQFKDPDGGDYLLRFWKIPGREPNISVALEFKRVVFITYNAKCDGESIVAAGGRNLYAIQFGLEGGGTYCIDG